MPTFHNQFQPRATRATVYQLRADVLCPDLGFKFQIAVKGDQCDEGLCFLNG